MKLAKNIIFECKGGDMKPMRGRLLMSCNKATKCTETASVVPKCVQCDHSKLEILDLQNKVLSEYTKKQAVKKPAKRKKKEA